MHAASAFPSLNSTAYDAIAQHQLSEATWAFAEVIKEVHRFRDMFDAEFALATPDVVFGIGPTRMRCYGYFRPGHNQFAIEREIILNARHVAGRIDDANFADVLGTVLHELLHAWQQRHGRPGRNNYHNVAFRRRAAECGLIVDSTGYTTYEPGGAFERLLARYGIPTVSLKRGAVVPRAAETKLKKWVCGCRPAYGVRVAVPDFRARCLVCCRQFARE